MTQSESEGERRKREDGCTAPGCAWHNGSYCMPWGAPPTRTRILVPKLGFNTGSTSTVYARSIGLFDPETYPRCDVTSSEASIRAFSRRLLAHADEYVLR